MFIKGKTVFIYDIEIFPNLFSVAIKNTESKAKRWYQISQWRNDITEIAKLFLNSSIFWCGYNNLHYDDPLINALLINIRTLVQRPVWEINAFFKDLSDTIINSKDNNFSSWSKYKYAHLFPSLDLLAMRFSQKLRVGLKEMQVTMQYSNVEEYDGDFNLPVTFDQLESIKGYNFNDVDSTEELLNRSIKDIELRLAVEEEFGINALNKDGVNLGMEIIKTKYLEATGLQWKDIRDLRSPCDYLCFGDIIFPYIEFKTPELQQLLAELKAHCADPNDNTFERKFFLCGVEHTFGMGGLHSVNHPEKFEPDEDWELYDDDVASLYPSIVIQNMIYPQHLGSIFVEVYKKIRDDRIEAKRNGNKLKNETYKLAINGLTGNLQSPYSWVYDPKAVLKIRINGQLLLLMYLEALSMNGAKIIQSNTDGVLYQVHKSLIPKMNEIKEWWQHKTGLELEREEFERFYQYAINDYLGVKKGYSKKKAEFEKGEARNKKGELYKSLEEIQKDYIKQKGLFITKVSLGKGMAPMIIPEAINNYFIEGIDPKDTLYNCKDVLKFCTYQKVAKDFIVEYKDKPIRHINRYYMSTKGGRLIKYKMENGERIRPTNLCADSAITIYNTFDNISISDRNINYKYYLHEIYKIIDVLDCQQLTLWS